MAIGHITLSTPSDQPAYATTAKVLAAQSTPEMKPHLASIDHTMVDRMVYPLRKGDINPTTLIEALSHIRTILLRYKENYSWGTVLMVGDNSNWKPVPTAVLGFPQTTTIELPKDMAMDIIVTNDLFSDVVTAPSTWMNSVSVNHNRLNISGVSVGVTGLTTEASTFGGYVHTSRQIYGITAAHVAPAPIRSEICSPSTVELTARLRAILPYTNLDANPIRIRPVRQQEADNMITKYRRRYDSINGIETVEGKILLSGAKLGNSVANRFTYYEGIFQSHNSRLEEAGRGTFVYPNEASQDLTRSKLDWLLFEVNDERLGGNIYDPDQTTLGQPVVIGPGDSVLKVGRTTGETRGVVNAAVIQQWHDNQLAIEIGVIGVGGKFADVGDSGSLCVVEMSDGSLRPAGLVVGKNNFCDAALVTPMWAVLDDMSSAIGEKVEFL